MKQNRVLIFDLDDTLYPEFEFFNEGLIEVANFIESVFGFNASKVHNDLLEIEAETGRSLIFDTWLDRHGLERKWLRNLIQVYRFHAITFDIPQKNREFIMELENSTYLITDGNKRVQSNKIRAFGLNRVFKKCFVTNQYGLKYQKPSIYCFDLVRQLEETTWSNLIYIGDNPMKDFVALNAAGGITIQTFEYANKNPNLNNEFNAKYSIQFLEQLQDIL